MIKLLVSIGLVLCGLIATPLESKANSSWSSSTKCVYSYVSTSGSLDANAVPCTVKYTPWSIYAGYSQAWDIKFRGYVFEVLLTPNGYYYLSVEGDSEATPVNYTNQLSGYHCWVDAGNSPEFLLCYGK